MERFVDLAYQRDGEEPQRWAFCSLAQANGPARTPAPLAEGTFYRADAFRLAARSPLPLPEYLCVSRNHFNLEWTGERRLKNAVMVLEWVPSAAAVARAAPRRAELTPPQQERLRKALALLDLDGSGSFDRAGLREALRSAEDLQAQPAPSSPP